VKLLSIYILSRGEIIINLYFVTRINLHKHSME